LWGGHTYGNGFDCSGFVLFCLADGGLALPDMTAQGLANHFHRNHKMIGAADPGDLLFYGDDADHIDHVMMVLDVWERNGSDWPLMVLVGARGGDDRVKTLDKAYAYGAMVDVVKGEYWRNRYQFILGIDK
jgi:hypothetical protein